MSDLPKDARHKFNVAKQDAKRRGIEFLFTFEEWWEFWGQGDRWSRRGRGGDKLVMARNGDTGPYALWNVHCCTYAENQAEITRESYVRRGIKSAATRRKTNNFNLAVRGAGHPNSRAVITPAGEFESGYLAADHYGITSSALYWRISQGWPGYRWKDAQGPRPAAHRAGGYREAGRYEKGEAMTDEGMTVRELIERLSECDPTDEVQIEQTNDNGPETVSAVVEYHHGVVILEGDLFQ